MSLFSPKTSDNDFVALLDANLGGPEGGTHLYQGLVGTLRCYDAAEFGAFLREADDWRRQGHYLCGYVSYEAAAFYGFAINQCADSARPLAEFGVFASRRSLSADETDAYLVEKAGREPWSMSVGGTLDETYETYANNIAAVQRYLHCGDSYQANYTIRRHGQLSGSVAHFYQRLRSQQRVNFGAFLQTKDRDLLSRSPELFFRKNGSQLMTRPMKGTAPRGATADLDRQEIQSLKSDPKQHAENIMIVDLLRNDMGRLAETGSVRVDNLCKVETYETLHQMTSQISARVDPEMSVETIFAALFPCGSITGAPKKRTCEIIAELESSPRGVYTGAIGYITPENDMCFSVPIRTLDVAKDGHYVAGVGSGIVYDSEASAEYAECRNKTEYLSNLDTDFHLIEAFKFSASDGLVNYLHHRERLAASAASLGLPLDLVTLDGAVNAEVADLVQDAKVRVELHQDGAIITSSAPLTNALGPKTVCWANHIIDTRNNLLPHKTSVRGFYDEARLLASADKPIYDVLFSNDQGHVTEASYHSVFIRKGDRYFTPPLSAGLLNGVGRKLYLEKLGDRVSEQNFDRATLEQADEVLLVSSIRGVIPVKVTT